MIVRYGAGKPHILCRGEEPRSTQTRTAPRSTAQSAPLRIRWLGSVTTASPLRSAWLRALREHPLRCASPATLRSVRRPVFASHLFI